MNEITILKLTISTLNTVHVSGKTDIEAMLGCINALESVVKIMELPPEPPAQEGPSVLGVNVEDRAMENLEVSDG